MADYELDERWRWVMWDTNNHPHQGGGVFASEVEALDAGASDWQGGGLIVTRKGYVSADQVVSISADPWKTWKR